MANLLDMLMGDQSNLFGLAGIGQPSGAGEGSTPSRPSPAPAAPAAGPQERPRRRPTKRDLGRAHMAGRAAATQQWKQKYINKSFPYYGDTPLPQDAQQPAKAMTMIGQNQGPVTELTSAEKKKITARALIHAGIATMSAAWHTVDRPSTLGDAMWAGFSVFMTSSTQSKEELMQLKDTQRRISAKAEIMDVGESPTREQALAMSRSFLEADMMPEAEYMRKYAGMLPEEKDAEELTYEMKVIDGVPYWTSEDGRMYDAVRNDKGELVEVGKLPGKQVEPKLHYGTTQDPDGTVWNTVRDESTGEVERIDIKERPPNPTGQKKDPNQNVANALERSVNEMEEAIATNGGKPFNVTQQWLGSNDITRFLASDEYLRFQSNAQNALSLVIRARSGAQASDKEVVRLEKVAVPLPGESAVQAARKFALLRAIISDYRGGEASLVDSYLDENQPGFLGHDAAGEPIFDMNLGSSESRGGWFDNMSGG